MRCPKCSGHMIREKFLDLLDDTGKFNFEGWRCLICGEVSDPVIQAHRKGETRPIISRKRKPIVGVN